MGYAEKLSNSQNGPNHHLTCYLHIKTKDKCWGWKWPVMGGHQEKHRNQVFCCYSDLSTRLLHW